MPDAWMPVRYRHILGCSTQVGLFFLIQILKTKQAKHYYVLFCIFCKTIQNVFFIAPAVLF